METFIDLKSLKDNPRFQAERRKTLSGLEDDMIDKPIRDLIQKFNGFPYCFTLQCYIRF